MMKIEVRMMVTMMMMMIMAVSRESGEEDLGARELLRHGYSAGPVSQTCFT